MPQGYWGKPRVKSRFPRKQKGFKPIKKIATGQPDKNRQAVAVDI
jgi:hypothetical protein